MAPAKLNTATAQRSVLRMMTGQLKEQPWNIEHFPFLYDLAGVDRGDQPNREAYDQVIAFLEGVTSD